MKLILQLLSMCPGAFCQSNPLNTITGNVGYAHQLKRGRYFTGGAAIAITRSRRFWVGTSAHFYLANVTKIRTTAG
jgi:hypothetical protein